MSTLNNYIYQLYESINEYTDDTKISLRLLEQYIINYRIKWFENTYNKFQKRIPEIYYQTICPELELTNNVDCCSDTTDCKILKTKKEIPSFMSLSDGEMLTKVSALEIYSCPENLFHILPYEQIEYFGNGRYNSKRIGVFIYNNYLYLISKDNTYLSLFEKINIRGIFRDPRETGKFKDCNNKPCWSPDSKYPLEERLWIYMKNDILPNELGIKLQLPEDTENDNKFRKEGISPQTKGKEQTS